MRDSSKDRKRQDFFFFFVWGERDSSVKRQDFLATRTTFSVLNYQPGFILKLKPTAL